MIQNKKRIISLILMLTLLVSALVVGAITASAEGEGSYVKVTSADDFTSGQYVIISNNNYALSAYDSSGWVLTKAFTASGDEIAKGDAPAVWTLTVSDAGVTLTDANGTSIKPKSGNNNGILTGSYSWSYSLTNGTFQFKGTGTDTTTLSLNTGSGNKARAYKNTTVSGAPNTYPSYFTLYKFVESTSGEEGGETPACEHTNTEAIGEEKNATCTEAGITAGEKCSACGETITAQKEIPALGHNYVDGACSVCGAEEPNEVVFDFGANGNASHVDGTDYGTSKEYVVDNNTLKLESMSKVFGPAYDAKGNSCIKLGTSSVAGKFSFTVPNNVHSVTIYVAGYKNASANISVNGGSVQNITTLSNNGEYTAIEVDTSTNKTVSFTTASGGYRAMINSIVFVFGESGCEHEYVGVETKSANCIETGVTTYTCGKCGDEYTEDIEITDHTFVEGICTVCHLFYSYTFEEKVFAGNESKMLENIVWTVLGNSTYFGNDSDKGHQFGKETEPNTELKVILSGFNGAQKIVINTSGASSIEATLVVKIGETKIGEIELTSTATEYTFTATEALSGAITLEYTQTSSKAIYIKSVNVYGEQGSICDHSDVSVVDTATCTEGGVKTTTCNNCGYATSEDSVALGHSATCGHSVANVGDVYYESIKDAIDNAESGTITLIDDVTYDGTLAITNENIVIDLNGNNLVADGIVTFGFGVQIVDSGATKGLIDVDRDKLVFAPLVDEETGDETSATSTEIVPVWNGEGYVIADVTDRYVEVDSDEADKFIIDFKPKFDGVAHSYVKGGETATGLTFEVRITGGDFDKTYTVTDDIIAQAYAGKSVRLNLINAKEGVTYTVQLIIKSECGLHYVGELGQYTYTVPADAE